MKVIALTVLTIAAALPVSAETFDLVGRVRTQEHRRIANASVVLYRESDNRKFVTRTNTFGRFVIRDLTPDDYVIEIRAKGFLPSVEFFTLPDIEPIGDFVLLRAGASHGRTRHVSRPILLGLPRPIF